MCTLNSFCGCFLSLKMDSMVAAGHTILWGLTGISIIVWELTGGLDVGMKAAKSQLSEEYPSLSEDELEGLIRESLGLEKVFKRIFIVFHTIWIVTGLLVFVGVAKERRSFLMPWIVMTSILTGLLILSSIVFIVDAITDHVYIFYFILIVGIVITGNIYGLRGVVSHYRNRCQEGKEFTGVDQLAYKKCPDEEI